MFYGHDPAQWETIPQGAGAGDLRSRRHAIRALLSSLGSGRTDARRALRRDARPDRARRHARLRRGVAGGAALRRRVLAAGEPAHGRAGDRPAHTPDSHRDGRDPAAAPQPAELRRASRDGGPALRRSPRVRRGPRLDSEPVPWLRRAGVGKPRALRRGARDHPPGVDPGALQLSRHLLPGRGRRGGAAPAPAAAPADPRRRPHGRELRAHRRSRGADLFRDDDHGPAAAARVHGALSHAPRRRGARVAERSDGAHAARPRRRDLRGGAGRHAPGSAQVLQEPRSDLLAAARTRTPTICRA